MTWFTSTTLLKKISSCLYSGDAILPWTRRSPRGKPLVYFLFDYVFHFQNNNLVIVVFFLFEYAGYIWLPWTEYIKQEVSQKDAEVWTPCRGSIGLQYLYCWRHRRQALLACANGLGNNGGVNGVGKVMIQISRKEDKSLFVSALYWRLVWERLDQWGWIDTFKDLRRFLFLSFFVTKFH